MGGRRRSHEPETLLTHERFGQLIFLINLWQTKKTPALQEVATSGARGTAVVSLFLETENSSGNNSHHSTREEKQRRQTLNQETVVFPTRLPPPAGVYPATSPFLPLAAETGH